jgi:apolipoprotein N-acyltransferase
MQEHLSDNNKTLAIGALETIHNMEGSYNSFLYFNGTDTQYYRKRHLVPFGEYFPVPDFLREWMEMNNLPSFDLMQGEKHQSLIKYNDEISIAAAICYEIAFGSEQLHGFPEANLLINLSNDAWFGDSIAPHQHLQITRMRAIETGRSIIRATNNGISAFINHKGKVIKKSGQFNYETLQHSVYPRRGSTLYVALGDTPVLLLSSFLILYVIRKKLLTSK